MPNARSILRNALIVCVAGILGYVMSSTVGAQEGDFALAPATVGRVQSGSNIQSASGVIKTLHRLALAEDYPDAEAFIALVAELIDGGVPPGTLLQVSKKLLSEPDIDLLETLRELAERITGGEPPGQVANEILERGNGNEGDLSDGGNGNGNSDDNGGGSNGNNGGGKKD
jgi:hypothetical protein